MTILRKLPLLTAIGLGAIAFSSSTGCVAYQVYSGAKMAKKGVDFVEDKLDDDKDKKKSSSSGSSSSNSSSSSSSNSK